MTEQVKTAQVKAESGIADKNDAQVRSLVWLRADLRLYDNPALFAATQKGPCVAVYLLCREQWRLHDVAPAKQDLIMRQLSSLASEFEQLNIPFWVVDCGDFSQVPDALIDTCHRLGIAEVFCNLEYELNERRLTRAVGAQLGQAGMTLHTYHDQCAIAPGQVLNKTGQMYRVFTSFRKAYEASFESLARPIWPAPKTQSKTGIENRCDALKQDAPESGIAKLWPAGEDEAHDRLGRFIEEHLAQYKAQRDWPSRAATSTLSPYLAIGALSTTQCFHALRSISGGELHSRNEGYVTWLHELIWREFYRHFMVAFPHVCKHQPFLEHTDRLPWSNDARRLQAWQEGRTGFPIVDAGMRQLNETGWMHNRVRMICAMFLSKHLFLDWRLGERYFMRKLVDGDLASNNGGWQWSASTGVDAVPYFRIFNPQRQSERFDPQGTYIRRYVPELRTVDDKQIHNPSEQIRRKTLYPEAIVDHKEAVARTKRLFAELTKPDAVETLDASSITSPH